MLEATSSTSVLSASREGAVEGAYDFLLKCEGHLQGLRDGLVGVREDRCFLDSRWVLVDAYEMLEASLVPWSERHAEIHAHVRERHAQEVANLRPLDEYDSQEPG